MGRVSTVFIGNIPYDTTEQQLRDIFGQVGRIESLRMVYDRDTGKPKGYGFCVYEDTETAQSALRNLSEVEVNGRRLRIQLSENETRNMGPAQVMGAVPGPGPGPVPPLPGVPGPPPAPAQMPSMPLNPSPGGPAPIPMIPPQTPANNLYPLPPARPSSDKLTLAQVHTLMIQVKEMGETNPEQLKALLVSNPMVTHALLQGQIMLGLVPVSQVRDLALAEESDPTD